MPRPPTSWIGLGLAACLAAATACTQAPQPTVPGPEAPDVETVAPDAPEVLEPVPPAPEEAAAAEAKPDSEAEPAPEGETESERNSDEAETGPERRGDDATVIPIVEPRHSQPRTLWEAAVEARKLRDESPPPRIRIDNETLHEYQDGQLTFAEPSKDTEEEKADTDEAKGGDGEEQRGEEYWRSTVRDLRLRLRSAVDELSDLDDRAAGLRRSFYAEDDPYVRDGEIKPAWDRVLDRIDETRRDIVDLQRRLKDTLQAGREAGALPGWLREGIELEPEPDELPQPSSDVYEPGEPKIMEIEPPPGRS